MAIPYRAISGPAIVGEMPESARAAAAREILDAHAAGTTSLFVAIEMVRLLRDVLEPHDEVVASIQTLPRAVQDALPAQCATGLASA